MSQYFKYGVKLTQNQKDKLLKAYEKNCPITFRLEKSQLKGKDKIKLTKTQINKIRKSKKLNKGVDIKISKSQIRKVVQHGGSLWSSLAGLSSRILPMALPLVKKAAARLATGALSGLELFDSKKGGFLIPDKKVNQLIQYKDMLTAKQKQDILNALQSGSSVYIKPTRKQIGAGWGTNLASIGIPMLLDAFTGKGLQVDSNRSRSRRSLPVHVPKPTTQNTSSMKKDGSLVSPMDMMYRGPPFIGSWDQNNMIGYGKPKTKKGRRIHNTTIRNSSIKNMEQSTSCRKNNFKIH